MHVPLQPDSIRLIYCGLAAELVVGFLYVYCRALVLDLLHNSRRCCRFSVNLLYNLLYNKTTTKQTRMWPNAQCYGRPAEYRWHPLFNAAKFG